MVVLRLERSSRNTGTFKKPRPTNSVRVRAQLRSDARPGVGGEETADLRKTLTKRRIEDTLHRPVVRKKRYR